MESNKKWGKNPFYKNVNTSSIVPIKQNYKKLFINSFKAFSPQK